MRRLLLLALLVVSAEARPLRVIATTTLVADVARQVAGDAAAVESLVPFDADPHAFQPAPRDVARLSAADVVLLNGLGLEKPFEQMLAAIPAGRAVEVSRTIVARPLDGSDGHAGEQEQDPHVWFDPMRVRDWVSVIEAELAARDVPNAAGYHARAAAFRTRLEELDRWARERLARVPAARRKLVTDHDAFGYFAARYGFEIVGAVLPGFSTMAEPSAREMAGLMDAIRRAGVPVIFVEKAAQSGVARRLAADAGVRVVELPTCALNAPGGAAASYEAFFRLLVNAIAESLAP